jgi:hypothetical protein
LNSASSILDGFQAADSEMCYMEGVFVVSPYVNSLFDPRAKIVAEAAAMEALKKLNKLTKEPYSLP